jgi:hypothetical protein
MGCHALREKDVSGKGHNRYKAIGKQELIGK